MSEIKYLNLEMLTLYDSFIKSFINSRIFIGTMDEYNLANQNGDIPINTLVIITDDSTSSGGSGGTNSSSTSSLLGTGVLGYMNLG